jgi:hypothetical protein
MSKLLDRPIRRTTLVAAFCAAVLVGTGLARIVHFESTLCVASLLLMVAIWRFGSVAVLLAAILAGLCLGGWRGTEYMSRLAEYQQFYGQKVTVVGIAGSDAVYNQQKQLAFDISDVYVADAAHTPLVGKIAISGFGENVIFRGDTVQVTGKLKDDLRVEAGQADLCAVQGAGAGPFPDRGNPPTLRRRDAECPAGADGLVRHGYPYRAEHDAAQGNAR